MVSYRAGTRDAAVTPRAGRSTLRAVGPGFACFPAMRALRVSRFVRAAVLVLYAGWATGITWAAQDAMRGTPATEDSLATTESSACEGEACCCPPGAHYESSCPCAPADAPLPGLPAWSSAPCGGGAEEDAAAPAASKVTPHVPMSGPCIAAPMASESSHPVVLELSGAHLPAPDHVPLKSR